MRTGSPYDFSSQQGLGAAGILYAVGGIFAAWFVFLFVMDSIREGHSEKQKFRQEMYTQRDADVRKANEPKVQRNVKGYQMVR